MRKLAPWQHRVAFSGKSGGIHGNRLQAQLRRGCFLLFSTVVLSLEISRECRNFRVDAGDVLPDPVAGPSLGLLLEPFFSVSAWRQHFP